MVTRRPACCTCPWQPGAGGKMKIWSVWFGEGKGRWVTKDDLVLASTQDSASTLQSPCIMRGGASLALQTAI
eukprot:scaffold34310_cov31-Tisochrysis_lutea.AAC.4